MSARGCGVPGCDGFVHLCGAPAGEHVWCPAALDRSACARGRYRLIAMARLPEAPPSDDDVAQLEPIPEAEARALLGYVSTLEALLRRMVALDGMSVSEGGDELGLLIDTSRALLGLRNKTERHHEEEQG